MAATSASPTLGHTEEDISTTVGADFKVGLDNSPELLHEFNFSMRHKRPASPIQKPHNGSFDINFSLFFCYWLDGVARFLFLNFVTFPDGDNFI